MKLVNVGWNAMGLGAPLLIAALTIPGLIQKIGIERFGLLSLAWGMIGFAGLFDLGIGRATTQTIAMFRGQGRLDAIPAVFRSAEAISIKSGIIGSAILIAALILGVDSLIKFSPNLKWEVRLGALILAALIPIQSTSAMFRGVNEGFESFRVINFIRLFVGILNFGGPYLVSLFSPEMPWLILILLISRVLALVAFRHYAIAEIVRVSSLEAARKSKEFTDETNKSLLRFGGWITVSALLSPIMMLADRYVIAGLRSSIEVGQYAIPYEVITQSLIVVGAITSVAFPGLGNLIHSNRALARRTFIKWSITTAAIMATVSISMMLLLPIALPLWVPNTLPKQSILAGQILCAGVLCNAIGSMYLALVHAAGRSDLSAKAHMLELPLFLVALYYLVHGYGIVGAAIAWTGRMALDAILLFLAAQLIRPSPLSDSPIC